MGAKSPSARLGAAARRGSAVLVVLALAVGPMVMGGPAGAVETRLGAEADTRVEQAEPDANFGSSSRLTTDLTPDAESYLRFRIPAGTGVITKVTLRLRVENSTSDGPEVRATTSAWDEATVTWNNRPAPLGSLLADAGRLSEGSWATFDVTAGVAGPGPVSFHLKGDSTDSAVFSSRQSGSNPPELLVESVSADGTTDTTVPASIDTHAEESAPDRNFGSDKLLKVQGGTDPGAVSYLRFAVGPLPAGVVRKATLQVYVTNDSVDGPAVRPTSGTWSETGLTWANRPAATGGVLTDLGSVDDGWVDLDVTALVTGAGTYNVLLETGSDDTFAFRSSEASSSQRPRLVVQTGPAPTTTTTSTSTTTTTSSTTTTTLPPTTTTTAPPTTTTTTAPPPDDMVAEAGEPWLGLARVVTNTCEPACVRSTYSLSIEDVGAGDTGDRRTAFRSPAGQSAELRLEWERSVAGGGCGTPGAVTMDVSMRRPNGGSRIGNAVWAAAVPATCNGVLLFPVHFDADPMDGDADEAPYYGVMELYGRLSAAGDATGADTRGAGPADPGTVPGRYARGHLVSGGVMVGWHESGDDAARLAANEATLGEPFGLVRSYSPTWKTPSTRVRDWLGQGKFVLWSVKPPADLNGDDDWTPVADGSQDAVIRQQVALLQSWAAAGRTEVGYIFNHEPHDNADILGEVDDCEQIGHSDYPCSGTPAEFIDVYERVRAIIDELGADRVKLVYTATVSRAAATAPGSSVPGSGDPMTRGEGGESVIGYVDLIAHDSYNWYCFRSNCNWDYPDESGGWGRAVVLAEAQGKQLIMAETASHPGCDGLVPAGSGCQNEDPTDLPSPTRDDWLRRIGTWLESDARARRWIVGFAYYHTLHTHDWRFVDQTGLNGAGVAGWRDTFVVDSPANDALGGHDYFTQYGFTGL